MATSWEKRELVSVIEEIVKGVEEDPNEWKMEEEYQRKYGTLSEEDLRKVFSI